MAILPVPPSCTTDAGVQKMRELAERYIQPSTLAAEVGTEHGGSALLFGAVCRERGARFLSIDGFSGNPFTCGPFSEEFFNQTRDRLRGLPISFLPMPSDVALEFIADRSLVLCYVDGGHKHPVVDEDLAGYAAKVMNGGVLCGHDYSRNHVPVMQAVDLAFGEKAQKANEVWYVEMTDELRASAARKAFLCQSA